MPAFMQFVGRNTQVAITGESSMSDLKFLIHGRQVRLSCRNIIRNKNEVHTHNANWLEYDVKTGVLRIALNGAHTIRFQVTRTGARNSRSEPGMRRINFTVQKKDAASIFNVGVLLTHAEEAELEKYVGDHVQLFTPPAPKLFMKRETTFGALPRFAPNLPAQADFMNQDFASLELRVLATTKYDEAWRYSGSSGWLQRKIRNHRATTGTYVILAPTGVLTMEYESRTIAKQCAEVMVKRGEVSHATVMYVSATFVQGKGQWIEREASRYD